MQYDLKYQNENKFKKLEKSVKKHNMVVYKKLIFDIYPALREGNFIGKIIFNEPDDMISKYELKLSNDVMPFSIYADIVLYYTVYENKKVVMLNKIDSENILDIEYQEAPIKVNLLDTLDIKNTMPKDKINLQNMYSYDLEYSNEALFKQKEMDLRKYQKHAYRNLIGDVYRALRKGDFKGNIVSTDNKMVTKYELKLSSDIMSSSIYEDIVLHYTVYENKKVVMLDKITPENF